VADVAVARGGEGFAVGAGAVLVAAWAAVCAAGWVAVWVAVWAGVRWTKQASARGISSCAFFMRSMITRFDEDVVGACDVANKEGKAFVDGDRAEGSESLQVATARE
jgi:hypothetical protein